MFITKVDTDALVESQSGVKRAKKTYTDRYDLIPLWALKRIAELYGRGAVAHGENNWQKAHTQEDLDGFKRSAMHHMFQYLNGENPEEDHFAAIVFNLIGMEHVKEALRKESEEEKK